MASLRKRGRVWYFRFVDADGVAKERKGCSDKRATEELARAAESEAAKIREGLLDPATLRRLEHARTPLADHVAAFRDSMNAKGLTAKHVDLTIGRVRRLAAVVKGAAFADLVPPKNARRADLAKYEAELVRRLESARLADLTADSVQAALRAILDAGAGPSTANHYRTAIKAFGKWAWRSGRVAADPFAFVVGYNADEDVRRDRRTIGLEELRRLVAVANAGEPVLGVDGPTRALVYRLAVATGLRYSEIRSLKPESFDFSARPAVVRVEAANAKNRREALQSLPDDLAADLRALVAAMPPAAAVFALPKDKGANLLRADLKAAEIPYVDAAGRVFDFHSLRCQTATLLDAAGVSPRVAQRVMRHSTPGLTDKYTRPRAVDVEAAALAIPTLGQAADGPDAARATGTDGQIMGKPRKPSRSAGGTEPSRGAADVAAPGDFARRPMDEPERGAAGTSGGFAASGTGSGDFAHRPAGGAEAKTVADAGREAAKPPKGRENLAHYLPIGGAVSCRKRPHPDVMPSSDEQSTMKRLEAEKTGFAASRRLRTEGKSSTGARTRTGGLRIMRPPL